MDRGIGHLCGERRDMQVTCVYTIVGHLECKYGGG